jgi:hypothetical protein
MQTSVFKPTPAKGSKKYGTTGGCSSKFFAHLELPKDTADSLANFGNLGIAQSTWNSYKTAQIMLLKCAKDTGQNMEIPLSSKQILIFIDWLARTRKLKATTINSYLSGVRQLYVMQNIDPPEFRTGLVKLVLKGISNRDGITTRTGDYKGRLPITVNVMLLYKNLLNKLDYIAHDKAMIWAASTLAFAGAFRISELLCKRESSFDPDFELLTENVRLRPANAGRTIQVTLKCPKENKSNIATTVDVFQNDGPLCPVRAMIDWGGLKPENLKLPLFRFADGTPLTGAKLNKILELTLGRYTDKTVGKFTTHSFRIGLATELGMLGCSDEEIKEAGRWSSRAFERYIKLKRTKRTSVAKTIKNLNGTATQESR